MTTTDWILFALIGYAAVITTVLLLVRGGRLAEDAERAARERSRWEYERGQR